MKIQVRRRAVTSPQRSPFLVAQSSGIMGRSRNPSMTSGVQTVGFLYAHPEAAASTRFYKNLCSTSKTPTTNPHHGVRNSAPRSNGGLFLLKHTHTRFVSPVPVPFSTSNSSRTMRSTRRTRHNSISLPLALPHPGRNQQLGRTLLSL